MKNECVKKGDNPVCISKAPSSGSQYLFQFEVPNSCVAKCVVEVMGDKYAYEPYGSCHR